jgi:hypothetical protein
LLLHGFICSDMERLLRFLGSLGSFWTESVWPVCLTGLTGFPCLCEAKSNISCLTGFKNRSDRFGLPAAVSCVVPLRVCWGCWLGLAPRLSSTPVATWTWQEKLAEVHEWIWVHRPNSWIEFLSAPIHSPLSGSPFRSFRKQECYLCCSTLSSKGIQDQGSELRGPCSQFLQSYSY